MNGTNTLLIASAIFLPILLITLNFSPIQEAYQYTIPLNKFTIQPGAYTDDDDFFKKIRDKPDSECFTTTVGNLFCFEKPRMYDLSGVSYVKGPTGVDGELHLDPIENGVSYFTMTNMIRISGDTVLVEFADKDYRIGNQERVDYQITNKFNFSAIVNKFDTFITHCGNYDGTAVTVVQYLGVKTIDDQDYFATWHTVANSSQGIDCDYPQIIKHSLSHIFREL